MAINKVEYGGDTLIDITDTTANAGDVVQGKTFYTADGNRATGSYNETDPVFSASPAAGITVSNITVWNNKLDYVSNDAANYTYTVAHNSNAISLVTVANGNKIDISNVPTTDTVTSTIRKVPTSGAVYDALRDKQDTLVSGTNIKTINSQSIVGSGNVDFYGTELPIGTEVDYVGTTVPTGWQEINEKATILWSNPNPSSTFAAQNIVLSSDDYDVLKIYFKKTSNENRLMCLETIKGFGIDLHYIDDSCAMFSRGMSRVNDTTFSLASAKYKLASSSSTVGDNSRCVPIYIVGYKTGLF